MDSLHNGSFITFEHSLSSASPRGILPQVLVRPHVSGTRGSSGASFPNLGHLLGTFRVWAVPIIYLGLQGWEPWNYSTIKSLIRQIFQNPDCFQHHLGSFCHPINKEITASVWDKLREIFLAGNSWFFMKTANNAGQGFANGTFTVGKNPQKLFI